MLNNKYSKEFYVSIFRDKGPQIGSYFYRLTYFLRLHWGITFPRQLSEFLSVFLHIYLFISIPVGADFWPEFQKAHYKTIPEFFTLSDRRPIVINLCAEILALDSTAYFITVSRVRGKIWSRKQCQTLRESLNDPSYNTVSYVGSPHIQNWL